jgi:hypothetical protein
MVHGMNSIISYTCPANEYRVGAFGRTWTKGFAVVLAAGGLLRNRDGSVMCFRTKSAAMLAAQ